MASCTPGSGTKAPVYEGGKKSVSQASVDRIVAAIGKLRILEDQKVTSFDGSMFTVGLTYADARSRRLSPEATCGANYDKIVAGEDELRVAFDAAQAE